MKQWTSVQDQGKCWIRFSFPKGTFLEKEFDSWEEAVKAIKELPPDIDWKQVNQGESF